MKLEVGYDINCRRGVQAHPYGGMPVTGRKDRNNLTSETLLELKSSQDYPSKSRNANHAIEIFLMMEFALFAF